LKGCHPHGEDVGGVEAGASAFQAEEAANQEAGASKSIRESAISEITSTRRIWLRPTLAEVCRPSFRTSERLGLPSWRAGKMPKSTPVSRASAAKEKARTVPSR